MMVTDLDIDHGVIHEDHMGTEEWRRAIVAQLEAILDAPKPDAAVA